MLWLTRLIRGALYPGAPFERQFMALEAMQLMLQVRITHSLSGYFMHLNNSGTDLRAKPRWIGAMAQQSAELLPLIFVVTLGPIHH